MIKSKEMIGSINEKKEIIKIQNCDSIKKKKKII